MIRLRNHMVGVEQGETLVFSDFEHDGPMWTGEGTRTARRRVTFERPFRSTPAVQVGLAMWDIQGQTNQRADISTAQVTAEGFELVFRTWGDTKVGRVRANWLAIGEVAHDDDWQLD
ncbi:H-type lectin domain-containing protein [Aliiruegeria haliotis]|nr:H-type lectin domain-containing protein [Aliiruegeria haliotis]